MNIPALFNTLAGISWLQGQWLALLTILTVLPLFWLRRSGGVIFLFLFQFIAYGLLLYPFFPPHIALTPWLTGLFAAAALGFTSRQLGPAANRLLAFPLTPAELIWRGGLPILLAAAAWAAARWSPLQIAASTHITWVVLALIFLAAAQFFRRQPPLLLGITFALGLSGLALWQAVTLQSRLFIGFWLATILLTTLLTTYLMQRPPPP